MKFSMDSQFLMKEAKGSCSNIVRSDLSRSQVYQELFPLTKKEAFCLFFGFKIYVKLRI